MDPMWIWIGLGALALIVIVGLFATRSRRARSESLRDQFSTEYARAQEVERYEIRPLKPAERERYRAGWTRIEAHFGERPTAAVVEADELVADMMRVQGYPMGKFEKHAADLSVKHPHIVEHYRAGHSVMEAAPGSATTEDLRQSMLHYRALIEQMLREGSGYTATAVGDV